jgi:hypothetical protein
MLSKCANPDCHTTLHYLREGRVFKVESDSELFLVEGKKRPPRKVEHFWLCGPCSETSTLVKDQAGIIKVMAKPLVRRAAAS